MPARTQKKFRIEIQQAQGSGRHNGFPTPRAGSLNGTAHHEILHAIETLRQDLLAGGGSGAGLSPDTERIIQEKVAVENELKSLSRALDDTKREIAGLRYSALHGDRLVSMNNQLDAVVEAAEDATNRILSAAETIDQDLQRLQQNSSDEDEIAVLEKLGDEVIKIFEACNFQDLTGQRITKVIETLKYVEKRVDSMIKGLGGDESAFAELAAPEPEEEEGIALQGPQRSGEGISQEDIDSLFD